MRAPFLFFIVAICFAFFPQSASAQAMGTYICGAGPGPGERQVGVTPGGNGVASLPICEAVGQSAPSGPPQQWIDAHIAVAGHDDANSTWTAAGYRYASTAVEEALNACNAAMSSGCKIYMQSYNGSVITLRDNYGGLWWSSDATLSKAKRAAFKNCESKGYTCEEAGWTKSQAWLENIGGPALDNPKIFPPGHNDFRKSYAAVAWVTDKEKWTQKVWITARQATAEAAKQEVLSACNNDSGTTCTLVLTLSDTAFYVGVDENKAVRVGAALSMKDAEKQMETDCKKAKAKCKMTRSFSAWAEGTWIHDPYYVDPKEAEKK
jgi:hypothetical protein